MRILLINKFHSKRDGGTRAYFDTAHILAEKGHEIAFFAMEHPDNESTPWSRFFVRQVDYLDEKQSFFSKVRIGLRILWNFEANRKLKALIEEFQPDIAHLHVTYHQLSPSILWTLKRYHIPIVMTLHDYKVLSPSYSLFVRGKVWSSASGWQAIIDRAIKDSLVRSVLCAVEKWLHGLIGSYRKVDLFIAPSQFLIQKFRELGSLLTIQHVPQPLFPFPNQPAVFGEGDYFLYMGRLSAEKGVQFLLETFEKLPQEKLVIVGTGPEEMALKALQTKKNLTNITFAGRQTGEAWRNAFLHSKALILPSLWYENMPYVMLEAFGFGKPVIGSNLGGIPERIQEGKNGFLFEAGNTNDLARAIQMLSTSKLSQLGRNAWDSIQDLQPQVYGRMLEDLYQSLLDKNKGN